MPSYYGQSSSLFTKVISELLSVYLSARYRQSLHQSYPSLSVRPSKLVDGATELFYLNDSQPKTVTDFNSNQLIVGSIRMGYSHHRIARSVLSWLEPADRPILHDLLSIDSSDSGFIRDMEALYSFLSRLSVNFGGGAEYLWSQLLTLGSIDSLMISTDLARRYANYFHSFKKDQPYLATYPFASQIAVAAGLTNVINIIPDTYSKYYMLSPNSLNLVQTESSYQSYISMNVPKTEVRFVGHFVPRNIVESVVFDSENRILRRQQKRPMRCLLSLGGIGLQIDLMRQLITKLLPILEDTKSQTKLHLLINTGEHTQFATSLVNLLESRKIAFTEVDSQEGLSRFCNWHKLDSDEPSHSVTIFRFNQYELALRASDDLIRCADLLIVRPSQIAFFPIPKILLKRLVEHEKSTSNYLQKIDECDGESKTATEAANKIILLCKDSSQNRLIEQSKSILQKYRSNLYHGAKIASEIGKTQSQKFIDLATNGLKAQNQHLS
ncbi:MAG: hypothetical protein H3C43_02135 [Leptonema sp. (in: Bacteria)]|nr:hypothetical protein [Leptonema sp. (in: bacteria)]